MTDCARAVILLEVLRALEKTVVLFEKARHGMNLLAYMIAAECPDQCLLSQESKRHGCSRRV